MTQRSLRLLLVDDNPADRDLLRAHLEESGLEFQAAEASTLAETRDRVRSFEPQCVLLDMNLPDGRASDIVDELAKVRWAMGVIVVTGQARDRDALETIRGGAQDYIDKSHLEPEMLAMTVRNAVERAQLSHERSVALAALERADQRKTELMAMLGHELRNPLNAITTALELVDEDDQTSRTSALAVIRRQTKHLGRLVDDLLEASRVSRGRIDLRREPVRLEAAAAAAADVVRPVMQGRGHSFELSLPEESLEVYGDPIRLEQMLVNLLSNAAKYTDEGGHVKLSLAADGDQAIITVEDDGVGMDADTLKEVFEPFVQAERSLARSEGGLGLGLALVRKLAILHGGSVEAHSPGLGKGSTLRVTLPRRWQQPALVRTGPLEDGTPTPTGKRVLLVEDHEDAAELLTLLLRRWGFDVSVATDGERGLELLESVEPHIVLLDIGLPKMNGYQVAQRIRENPAFSSVRLLAVSGYGSPEDLRRSEEAGFDAHLIKPVDPAELRRVMTAA